MFKTPTVPCRRLERRHTTDNHLSESVNIDLSTTSSLSINPCSPGLDISPREINLLADFVFPPDLQKIRRTSRPQNQEKEKPCVCEKLKPLTLLKDEAVGLPLWDRGEVHLTTEEFDSFPIGARKIFNWAVEQDPAVNCLQFFSMCECSQSWKCLFGEAVFEETPHCLYYDFSDLSDHGHISGTPRSHNPWIFNLSNPIELIMRKRTLPFFNYINGGAVEARRNEEEEEDEEEGLSPRTEAKLFYVPSMSTVHIKGPRNAYGWIPILLSSSFASMTVMCKSL